MIQFWAFSENGKCPFCVGKRMRAFRQNRPESHQTKIKTEQQRGKMKFYFKLIAIPSVRVYTETADNVCIGRKRGIVIL